ncbi:phospholipase [Actinoplanes couchii]|uniref:Phospholipase A2 n=1 Tax=Actinoplanes couchii TaxID=403638 RepID=A0ABQ3X932_9ACTN|nr:phospholipase [Actinoplanes couchii]MDR6325885.1 hypothetical protein [Actinoplanes couchii]GID54945.1 hypothetical protein Aco03nite_033490 [Actinoplanes couchii]
MPGFPRLLALAATVAVVLGTASPAHAATAAGKAAVLASLTQTTAASYDRWNTARQSPDDYGFDWGTDYCSLSPDRPLGFDFRLSCHRHDFGYRNHKAADAFTGAAKDRIDDAFYGDLKRKCSTYRPAVRPACRTLALTYYRAVQIFGSTASVTQTDLDTAAELIG